MVRKSLDRLVKSGKLTEDEADSVIGRIKGTTDLKGAVKDTKRQGGCYHRCGQRVCHVYHRCGSW